MRSTCRNRVARAVPAAALLVLAGATALGAGCGRAPAAAEIEAVAMQAVQRGDAVAARRLADWAREGSPVAQRELALMYRQHRPGNAVERETAGSLFARAARQGDTEAAFQLGELARTGDAKDRATAAPWYRQAAERGHAKAALALALMYKNGDAIARDPRAAAHWLSAAATAGSAHAMFLLSNAYADGDGVPADPRHARALLERAADHEYPAAIQQLALVKQTGDAFTAKDAIEARQLLQEAAEHRRSNARRF
jgi:TPR repeat protein